MAYIPFTTRKVAGPPRCKAAMPRTADCANSPDVHDITSCLSKRRCGLVLMAIWLHDALHHMASVGLHCVVHKQIVSSYLVIAEVIVLLSMLYIPMFVVWVIVHGSARKEEDIVFR